MTIVNVGRQYLAAASDLLVSDLEEMVENWRADGDARKALENGGIQNGLKNHSNRNGLSLLWRSSRGADETRLIAG